MKEQIIATIKKNVRDILVEDELCGSDHPAMTHKFHNEMVGYDTAADEIMALFAEAMPTDEEIDNHFNTSHDNHIHPDRYRAEGAKWFSNRMKGEI